MAASAMAVMASNRITTTLAMRSDSRTIVKRTAPNPSSAAASHARATHTQVEWTRVVLAMRSSVHVRVDP